MANDRTRRCIVQGVFITLLCARPLNLTAQSTVESAAVHRLRASLQGQALELLARDGSTFYALGAVMEADGTIGGMTPDHWPALEAPPEEWRDSLVAAIRRIARPVRAAAMLIDLNRVTSPADTFASFHAETSTECRQMRIPILGLAASSAGRWGAPQPEPCEPLYGLAGLPAGLGALLRRDTLVGGRFVAYTLLWQGSVPGGDPIAFHADGTVENARAGLAGRWTVQDDSTLIIAGSGGALAGTPHTFRLRGGRLISPPTAGAGSNGTWWIESESGERRE
jgi:hypothetical protein